MPWYKFYAHHGPGHQSYDENYEWYDEKLERAMKEQEWDYWVTHELWDSPIGDVLYVRRLPEEIRQGKIKYCEAEIEAAQAMLVRLKDE